MLFFLSESEVFSVNVCCVRCLSFRLRECRPLSRSGWIAIINPNPKTFRFFHILNKWLSSNRFSFIIFVEVYPMCVCARARKYPRRRERPLGSTHSRSAFMANATRWVGEHWKNGKYGWRERDSNNKNRRRKPKKHLFNNKLFVCVCLSDWTFYNST